MSLAQNDGGLPPDRSCSTRTRSSPTASGCSAVPRAGAGAMVQIALAPCSPFSVTERLMRESAALAARFGVRLHTHLAETEDEEA